MEIATSSCSKGDTRPSVGNLGEKQMFENQRRRLARRIEDVASLQDQSTTWAKSIAVRAFLKSKFVEEVGVETLPDRLLHAAQTARSEGRDIGGSFFDREGNAANADMVNALCILLTFHESLPPYSAKPLYKKGVILVAVSIWVKGRTLRQLASRPSLGWKTLLQAGFPLCPI